MIHDQVQREAVDRLFQTNRSVKKLVLDHIDSQESIHENTSTDKINVSPRNKTQLTNAS